MSTQDKSRRTEAPTPHKLREARRKGHVVKSREITSTAVVVAAFAFFAVRWESLVEQLKEMTILSTTLFDFAFPDALKRMLDLLLGSLYEIVLPFMVTVVAAGILAHVVQFGVLFAWERVMPKMQRLNPVQGLGRICSTHNVVEAAKAALKTLAILAIVTLVLYTGLETLLRIPLCDVGCERRVLEHLSGQIALYLLPFFCLLAIADYAYQRKHFMREHMMSRDEIRRERRDADGAPELHSRRRQEQREMASSGDVDSASRATVVLTGDDLAVALYYDRDETPLPVVSLIARGEAANATVRIALAQGVPVEERADFAQSLARDANEGEYVPSQWLTRTAELLARLAAAKSS